MVRTSDDHRGRLVCRPLIALSQVMALDDDNHHDTAIPSADRNKPKVQQSNRPENEAGDRHPASDEDENPQEKNPPKNKKPWYRRPLLVGILMVVIIGSAVGGALWWRHSRQCQSTEDAAIDVVAQRVSPQIAGRVLRVLVGDNQDVAAGTVLVELDPSDFQAKLDQAQAAEAQAAAQIAEAQAQAAVADAQR